MGILLGYKESVYSIVEDVDRFYERYLSVQMGFVLTVRMYCYSVNYSLRYTGGLIPLESVLTKPRNEGIMPGVTR